MSVKDAIEKRRAYRSLAPVEITDELIEDLIHSASLAPSCFNKQPWRFVVVSSNEMKERLKKTLSRGNEWAKSGSLFVAVYTRKDLDCIYRGKEYFLFDTGLATAFLILRATELGLVAHPIAGFDETMLKKILGIPEDMILITLIVMGKHSGDDEGPRPARLPLNEISRTV